MSGPAVVRRALTDWAACLAVAALAACKAAAPDPSPVAEVPDVPRIQVSGLLANEFRVGNWLGISNTRDGRFDRCMVSARFAGAHVLYFSLDRNQAFGFAFGGKDWTLHSGDRHPIAYVVDDRHYAAMATAIFEDTLLIDPSDTELLFERFRSASLLSVDTLGGRFAFRLDGIAAALDALEACVQRNKAVARGGAAEKPTAGGGRNPFLPPERGHQPEGGGSNPFVPRAPGGRSDSGPTDAVTAAQRFVERLLTAAGFADNRILTGAEVPAESRHADVVWRAGAQIGTLLIVEARRYPSVVEASASIVKDASLACNEGFASTIAARRLRDDRPAAQMIVSCTRPTTFHADYTMVPVTGIGYYRLTLITFGDPREIDAMHERIGAALARVVPEE